MTTMISFYRGGTTCPDGWTSYTSGDGYAVQATTGAAGGTTSASGHTHTFTTQSGASSGNSWHPTNGQTTSSSTYEPPYIQLKGCSMDHDDVAAPPSMVMFTEAGSCPTGWTEVTGANGYFLFPATDTSELGSTVGQSTSHHHGTGSQGSGANNCISDTSTTDAGVGPYIVLRVCEKL